MAEEALSVSMEVLVMFAAAAAAAAAPPLLVRP